MAAPNILLYQRDLASQNESNTLLTIRHGLKRGEDRDVPVQICLVQARALFQGGSVHVDLDRFGYEYRPLITVRPDEPEPKKVVYEMPLPPSQGLQRP